MQPRRRRLLCAGALLTAGVAAADAPTVPGTRWPELPPAASGWSATGLEAADEAAAGLGSDAVLLVHRGALVHAFGDVARPLGLYSVRKSIAGILVGIHHARGRIDLQATLAQLGIDDREGLSAQERTATVQQLLQSRSGVYHRAAYETAAMADHRPARGSHPPGTHWHYNNWDFNVLAAVFERCTGRSILEALADDLARPLGFEDFDPARDARWHHERVSDHPAYLIDLSARDLARVGLLMARGGDWGGRRIVPAAWVAESTRVHSAVPGGWLAYGLTWWIPRRAYPFWRHQPGEVFFGAGNHGQFVFVDRGRDLVIVHRTTGRRLFRRSIDGESVAPLLQRLLAAAPADAAAR